MPAADRSSLVVSRPDVSTLTAVASLLAESIASESSPDNFRTAFGTFPRLAAGRRGAAVPMQDPISDLYLGTPGVAVFLAAQARISGEPRWHDLALRALEPTRAALRQRETGGTAVEPPPIGGLVGTGATVHALHLVSRLLDEPDLLAEAHALTSTLTPERIDRDRRLDVMAGSAGALLVLLALEPVAPAANSAGYTPLDLAVRCGAHLMRHLAQSPGVPGAGFSPAVAEAGFAHGMSGICVALSRLYRRTGDEALWDAVSEGADRERLQLRELSAAWRSGRAPASDSAWCRGACGFALSRASILENAAGADGAADLSADLALAAEFALAAPQLRFDHLCCGNMGRVDSLLALGVACGDERFIARAGDLAMGVFRAMKRRGNAGVDQESAPFSLFWGAAGIGYVCLRLVAPRVLPSLLAIDV